MEKLKTTRREFTKILVGSAGAGLSGFTFADEAHPAGQRIALPLDGEWEIEDGVEPESLPNTFGHTVPVPGLVHSATPAFLLVDQYEFREHILNMIRRGLYPPSEDTGVLGRTPQKRNYFWYRQRFRAPAKKALALLNINKAQFGTAVWLNGKKVGEHLGCFTAGHFNLTDAMDWEGENVLFVRIGAHPGALPDWVPAGTDKEKPLWTPGIYDRVSLHFCDNPVIESVQTAPRIGSSSVVVETQLHNYGPETSVDVVQRVKTWKGEKPAGEPVSQRVQLAKGEAKTLTQTVHIPRSRAVEPGKSFSLRRGNQHGRRSCFHSLWHARVPLRHGFTPSLVERQALLHARGQPYPAPLFWRSAQQTASLGRSVGAEVPGRNPQEHALE